MFFSCAAINGVEPAVVDRAEELVLLSARGEDLVTACTKISEQEEKDLEIAVGALTCLMSRAVCLRGYN